MACLHTYIYIYIYNRTTCTRPWHTPSKDRLFECILHFLSQLARIRAPANGCTFEDGPCLLGLPKSASPSSRRRVFIGDSAYCRDHPRRNGLTRTRKVKLISVGRRVSFFSRRRPFIGPETV